MHMGPLCPGAHVVVRTDNEGFPTMTRSAVKLSNSPDGVLFCNTSTKWVKRTAVAVVVLVGGGPPVLAVRMDEDEDEDCTADSLYSRIKLSSTFFPTSTDDTLTVYSTVVMFVVTKLVLSSDVRTEELSFLGLSSNARTEVGVACSLSSVSLMELCSFVLS